MICNKVQYCEDFLQYSITTILSHAGLLLHLLLPLLLQKNNESINGGERTEVLATMEEAEGRYWATTAAPISQIHVSCPGFSSQKDIRGSYVGLQGTIRLYNCLTGGGVGYMGSCSHKWAVVAHNPLSWKPLWPLSHGAMSANLDFPCGRRSWAPVGATGHHVPAPRHNRQCGFNGLLWPQTGGSCSEPGIIAKTLALIQHLHVAYPGFAVQKAIMGPCGGFRAPCARTTV